MLPIATTRVSVIRDRSADDVDLYDSAKERTTLATGVRAHFSKASGQEAMDRGVETTWLQPFDCDPIPNVALTSEDIILDENTGQEHRVVWAELHHGLGLDHWVGQARRVTGGVA